MKVFFGSGFLLGFAGLLIGAYSYPIIDHARIESLTSVAINGGRAETFLVRLPADRVVTVSDGLYGLRGRSYPTSVQLPEQLAGAGMLLEHFKLRDLDGHVIGLATHHVTETSDGPAGVWAVNVPGRGSVIFAGYGESPGKVAQALAAVGYRPGATWTGDISVQVMASEQTRVIAGTEEFRDFDGQYSETWNVTGISATGEIRGTIRFETLVLRRS